MLQILGPAGFGRDGQGTERPELGPALMEMMERTRNNNSSSRPHPARVASAALAVLALVVGWSSGAAQASLPFSDTFNRVNSSVVGNGWIETESAGNGATINANRLVFVTNDVDNVPRVQQNFAIAVSSGFLRLKFDFDWARGGLENFYSFFVQLGNSGAFGAPPADGASVPGAAINLRWGDDNTGFTTEEGFGYVQGTIHTRVATLTGAHTIEVIADLATERFDLKIDGTIAATGIAFDKSLAAIGGINAIRIYQGEGVSSGAGGNKAFDNLTVEQPAVGPASALTSTISASSGSIVANGSSTSIITVQLKDKNGANLTAGGYNVALATTAGTLSAVTDNGNGTYTATLTSSTTAGTATITGTLNGAAITDNETVTFTPGPASAATSTITAAPTSIVANGTSTSTVTVQLKDANGNNLTSGGATVVLATTAGTLSAVTDNGNGTYTATLTSSTVASTATVTGTVNGSAITDDAQVQFTAGAASGATSTISAAPGSIVANGTSTSTVTVQLKDANGNNLTSGGGTVVLATAAGSLSAVTDNGNGTYSATLTSSTTAGTATITGTVNGSAITDDAQVVLTPGAASGATSTISAAPGSIVANGTSTSTITVQLKDANGNNLTSGGATVVLATTAGSLSAVTDNGNGAYTATLTSSTTAGTATITGTVNGSVITDDAQVQFTAGAASPATSTISAAPGWIVADGSSTSMVIVRLKDSNGNNLPIGGESVVLATTAGSLSAVTDRGDGTYAAVLTSGITAGTAIITGMVNGVPLASSTSVQFMPGTASTVTSTISAAPGSIVANGTSTSTVTVQLKDASGNNLVAGGDAVVLATSAGTLSAVTDHATGTYTATHTSSTSASTATITGTVNGSAITDDAQVAFTTGAASPTHSTISAAPGSIVADGSSTATVTVRLKDASGNNLTVGGDAVGLAASAGTLSAVTDHGNGTYTATLTSSTTAGAATITGALNGAAMAKSASVEFTVMKVVLILAGNGDGGGRVVSEPAGIDCAVQAGTGEGTCAGSYARGTAVTLSAAPDTGSAFAGWNGPCGGMGDCKVTLNESLTLVASFTAVAEPNVEDAAQDLLGNSRLTAIERIYLDQWGNRNDAWDLGDFLGLLERTNQAVSEAVMQRLLKDPPSRRIPEVIPRKEGR
ncbi:MAG: invasin domain 3-containing protein [Gemmatimonadales bacterium]